MNDTLFTLPPQSQPRTVAGIPRNKDGSYTTNPMAVVHGTGPAGTRCKSCAHLHTKQFAKRYHKCLLRPGTVNTHSPRSDHRTNWWACAKFQPAVHGA